jgi:hypothetical protein
MNGFRRRRFCAWRGPRGVRPAGWCGGGGAAATGSLEACRHAVTSAWRPGPAGIPNVTREGGSHGWGRLGRFQLLPCG